MNSRNEARLGMYLAVSEYCRNNSSVITIPAIQNKVDQFNTHLEQLMLTVKKHAEPITGIASDKEVARAKLAESTFVLCCTLQAFAKDAGDNTILDKVKYSYTRLNRLRDTELLPVAQHAHDIAAAKISDLAQFGILPANLTAHANDIATYTLQLASPKTARSVRTTFNEALTKQFAEISELLDSELDKLVMTLMPTHPDFVNGYMATRRIDSNPSYATQTTGTVTKADKSAAVGAKVELMPTGTADVKYTAVTNSEGMYSIKGIKSGVYDVKVQYNGNPEPVVMKGVKIERRKANALEVVV